MKALHKIGYWAVDYWYLTKGIVSMIQHKEPPKHYLDYILPGKTAVILLPGFWEKWAIMKHLGDSISLHGHPVYIVPHLGHNISDIPTAAKLVKTFVLQATPKQGHNTPNIPLAASVIRQLIEKFEVKDVIVVAHSKGGLIGKYMLIHHNKDKRLKGVIAIATPFSGSRLARLIPHHSFRELAADSKIIQDLEANSSVNSDIVSIIPSYDNHVWSAKGSYLEGATNINVSIKGHHKVLFSKEVEDKVLESIEILAKK